MAEVSANYVWEIIAFTANSNKYVYNYIRWLDENNKESANFLIIKHQFKLFIYQHFRLVWLLSYAPKSVFCLPCFNFELFSLQALCKLRNIIIALKSEFWFSRQEMCLCVNIFFQAKLIDNLYLAHRHKLRDQQTSECLCLVV